jgi:hypothetical protein
MPVLDLKLRQGGASMHASSPRGNQVRHHFGLQPFVGVRKQLCY